MVREYSYARDGANFISPHFQIGEFKSFCDDWGRLTTDVILIDDNLPIMLEKLYNYLDTKFGIGYIYITTGYRSEDFEMYLAGFCGFHNQGKAADIMCYDRAGGLIPGVEVACAAQTVGFNGIGYIGNGVHVDVRDWQSWFDESKGCVAVGDFYDYFGVPRPSLPNPIERNIEKIQIEVVEPELYCRLGHSTESPAIGFVPTGIYNFIQYFEDGTYTWYEIESGKWIASNGEWVKLLNIEIPSVVEEPIEEPNNGDSEPKDEDNTNKPTEPNNDNEPKKNLIKWLVRLIVEFFAKIFKCKNKK